MCLPVLRCNLKFRPHTFTRILSLAQTHVLNSDDEAAGCPGVSVGLSPSVAAPPLSLTTLSAQEVISELHYHHQPYSAVRNTYTQSPYGHKWTFAQSFTLSATQSHICAGALRYCAQRCTI